MDDQIYWFITVFNYKMHEPDKFPYINTSRCWGFFTDKEKALAALHTNSTDMYETIYPYAVLEPYYEGLVGYCFDEPRQFFKYDKKEDGYFEIEEPKEFKGYVAFAIC